MRMVNDGDYHNDVQRLLASMARERARKRRIIDATIALSILVGCALVAWVILGL